MRDRALLFHVGEFDLKKPDKALLRFLRRAQADDLGSAFVESKELFPLSQQAHIPCVEVCFAQESVQEIHGHKAVRVAEEEPQPQNVYMVCPNRFALYDQHHSHADDLSAASLG